ncbi:MAG: DUF4302 domain-containing protein [Dysgonamonadaceae bacterium]|jgi:hypothetical protein|nr:DUF4302 domain-containing protein [Dysgonamonadaceae bacterium]
MKQNSHLYFLLSGLIFILTSCVRTEADLFDESSALRLNHAVADSKELLLSANNGWVMEYFPTNDSAGINFLIKFHQDEMAVVAAKNEYTPNYTESKGAWNVIGDTGPVLTFDTYIDVLHLFSDPNKGPEENLGIGYGGDYEFIIMNISDNLIQLKSKKRGITILMHRLDENQDWQDYFKLLDEMNATLFHKYAPPLSLFVADSLFILSNGISHKFDVIPYEADTIVVSKEKLPFIVTSYGFRLIKPFNVGEVSVQTFTLSEDKTYLYTVENQDARISNSVSSSSFFFDEKNWATNRAWVIDSLDLGGTFKTVYEQVVGGCSTALNENFERFFFQYKSNRRSSTLSFQSKTRANRPSIYEGAFDFDISRNGSNDKEVVFTYKGKADDNGTFYKNKIGAFQQFVDLISGDSFALTTDRTLSLAKLKFTSVSNPDNYFALTIE